ncbi:MAG TPA: TMEM165/GDT1 family protein [Burkholderiales bacterium]|nr:TMEM165/GDT1 family protein [Burkholderiales bacterium]
MQAFLTSAALIAVAEIGDKTQLLSFVLAARLRRPYPIIAGILSATLFNHTLAGSLGVWLAKLVPHSFLNWIVALSFIAFGLWTLHPDSLEEDPRIHEAGVFVTAFIAFFLAEMGDKTQLATIALAARFDALVEVVLGTTLGMLLADVPAVFIGEKLAKYIPMRLVRYAAATLFIALGLFTLMRPLELGA